MTNSQPFFILLNESNPSTKRDMNDLILFQIESFRKKNTKSTVTASSESNTITNPRGEESTSPPGNASPVSLMKRLNTGHCNATATTVISNTIRVSNILSITMVPNAWANGTCSFFSRITQRDTSPTRGKTRFAAYAT